VTPGVPRDPKTAIFCPKCPFLAIGTSNSSKWVGHWLDKVGYYQTHPEGSIWTLEAPKKWHRRPQRRQKFNKCIQKFNKFNKCIQTSGRVFALHSGLKRGVRWGVFGFEWRHCYWIPKSSSFNFGHKRTSRTLNRDLKVTKPGPNGQSECISLASVQISPHGSYQGHILVQKRAILGPNWVIKGPQGP